MWCWAQSRIATQVRLQCWDFFPRPGVSTVPPPPSPLLEGGQRRHGGALPSTAGFWPQLLPQTGIAGFSFLLFLPPSALIMARGELPAFLFLFSLGAIDLIKFQSIDLKQVHSFLRNAWTESVIQHSALYYHVHLCTKCSLHTFLIAPSID